MAIATTLAIAGTSALMKKALDDVYAKIKTAGINHLGKTRSDLKDATIARALSTITKVKTLWNVDKEFSLYEFYYPSNIIYSGGSQKKVTGLKEFGTKQNFVIQGTAGQGKSIFLRYLCGQELIPKYSSERIPLFIELRRIRTDFSVNHLILESLKKCKLPHTLEAWDFLANSGKFLLLMDAFDEIDPILVSQSISDIENISEMYGDSLQIIITSRPDADIQRSPQFRVCKLGPLTKEDHQPFLTKICVDKGQADSLYKVINSSSTEIQELLTTPLMMTLLVILYKSLQTVPDTVPKFFEELFDVLFYRHDHSKPGFRRKRFTQLDDSKFKKLFAAFCFYVRLDGLGVLTSEQLDKCLGRANIACNETVDPEKFKNELIKTVCLMQQDGFEYSFIHKSVLQYYAASFVRGSSEDFSSKFYKLASKPGQSWDLELRFLCQIDAFHYAKWYEIPLLNKIAATLDYSFSNRDSGAELRLNNYVMERVSLMFRPPDPNDNGNFDDDLLAIVGWSYNSQNDLVLKALASVWVHQIFAAVFKDRGFGRKLLEASFLEKVSATKLRNENIIRLDLLKDGISTLLPDLGKTTLSHLQSRYDDAALILRTEEEKTAMLQDLL